MDWLEISLKVDGEAAEAVASLFNRLGHGGAVTELLFDEVAGCPIPGQAVVKTFIPQDDQGRLAEIEQGLWHLGQIRPLPASTVREIKEEDWAEAWKKHFRPLRIGRLRVVPTWRKARADGLVIRLDPGMAFGTGLHPTTRMCLLALQKYLRPGDKVLDLGTGSGILAIASALLGAASVLALDIDPLAVEVAKENVRANGQQAMVGVRQGTLSAIERGETFDLGLVNILADTIIQLLGEGLLEYLNPQGRIIASGIVSGQEVDVVAALKEQGIEKTYRRKQGDWTTLIAQRN